MPVISTQKFTAHTPGRNFLLNKMMLLVINNSLTSNQTLLDYFRQIYRSQSEKELFT
jgi:hypothetical protein